MGQREHTCANGAAYVPTCPAVSVNSGASDSQTQRDYKNVRKRDRTELSSSATEAENERDLENKKRGGRQRCSIGCLCECGYEQTCAAACLEIHTHSHTHTQD